MVGLLMVAETAQSFDHSVLRLCLAGVNHVVDLGDITEVRMVGFTVG